jgi:hypothetical protein
MHKTITTALFGLASGLTLSATAVAEPFNHGSSYGNAISNAYSSDDARSAQSVQLPTAGATLGGFNDRDPVENGVVTINHRTVANTSASRLLSPVDSGFNNRG